MKNLKFKLLLIFTLLQTVSLFAQLDVSYYGTYKTADEETYFYVYQFIADEHPDFPVLTNEQKTNADFLFSFQNAVTEGTSVALPKGSSYVSVVTENAPEFALQFKYESGIYVLEVTDKGGNKLILNKMVEPDYYYEEEYVDSGYDYYGNEESIEFDSMDMRGYSRSDGATLVIIFSEEITTFSVNIPATKSCSEVMIDGIFDSPNVIDGKYTFTNTEKNYTLEAIATDSGWQFVCVQGECFDRKNKCGIWKEAFMQGD